MVIALHRKGFGALCGARLRPRASGRLGRRGATALDRLHHLARAKRPRAAYQHLQTTLSYRPAPLDQAQARLVESSTSVSALSSSSRSASAERSTPLGQRCEPVQPYSTALDPLSRAPHSRSQPLGQ